MPFLSIIAGARPNFMKVAPVLQACDRRGIDAHFVHTGQHYDINMSSVFLEDLGLRQPDVNLAAGSGTHAQQTASIMTAFEKYFLKEHPEWTVVFGDVNSSPACALVSAKLHGKVCHIEAGLRSGDWIMPEEVNRIVTDRLSSLLLTPLPEAEANLLRRNTPKSHQTGRQCYD